MFLKLVKLQNGTYNEKRVNIFSLNTPTQPLNTKAILCLVCFDKLFK